MEVASKKLASVIARILDDKLASDILILDISKVSSMSDYFVIASAQSSSQVKGLTENLKVKIKEFFEKIPSRIENDPKNRWNLLDYGDVVVHIMHTEQREVYALEKFWNHALKLSKESWMNESEEYSVYKN